MQKQSEYRKIPLFLRRVSIGLLTISLALGGILVPKAEKAVPSQEKADIYAGAQPLTQDDVIQNGSLSMKVDPSTGFLTIEDAKTGMTYTSNPVDYEQDTLAQGVNITRMISQILVTFLNQNKSVDEVNSFVGAVTDGELIAQKNGSSAILTYVFKEQGFTIPVVYTLTDNSFVVSIDYDHVKEAGKCRILNITLLPFFGAARMEDKGFFILPDGSGSYVEFNNGKYAQGEYRREIYTEDLTNTSETKPNDYRRVMLPMFASVYRYVTPPVQPQEWDAPVQKVEGKNVRAGFLAHISSGAAGAYISTAVAGGDTGYNTSHFQFLYRSSMETSFLSRTWAEIKRVLFSEQRCMSENPSVEYRFLDENNSSIKGVADLYSQILLGNVQREGSKNQQMYLDVYNGVRAKQQFMGFSYDTVVPLTTLKQTDQMLTELKDNGVNDFVVMLKGYDASGAYYGSIDTKLSIDGKIGNVKQLNELVGKWKNVYPEVQLTQFNRNKLGYNSFFDSVTAINKKTVKRIDYHYATGLRDYKLPQRYLLKPDKVKQAADKLKKDMQQRGILNLAPNSLGTDLYSNFAGSPNQIGDTQHLFKNVLADLSDQQSLLLEQPNAYAIPYADKLLHLAHTDSGHFISNESIPFIQLVVDGIKGYSTPPANYASNLQDMLLYAIESNSALAFSVMGATYEDISRTSMNRLYASEFDGWKKAIIEAWKTLQSVRDATENSCIQDFEIAGPNVHRVTFENGTVIYVNYNAQNVEINGKTIAAKAYLLENKEG